MSGLKLLAPQAEVGTNGLPDVPGLKESWKRELESRAAGPQERKLRELWLEIISARWKGRGRFNSMEILRLMHLVNEPVSLRQLAFILLSGEDEETPSPDKGEIHDLTKRLAISMERILAATKGQIFELRQGVITDVDTVFQAPYRLEEFFWLEMQSSGGVRVEEVARQILEEVNGVTKVQEERNTEVDVENRETRQAVSKVSPRPNPVRLLEILKAKPMKVEELMRKLNLRSVSRLKSMIAATNNTDDGGKIVIIESGNTWVVYTDRAKISSLREAYERDGAFLYVFMKEYKACFDRRGNSLLMTLLRTFNQGIYLPLPPSDDRIAYVGKALMELSFGMVSLSNRKLYERRSTRALSLIVSHQG